MHCQPLPLIVSPSFKIGESGTAGVSLAQTSEAFPVLPTENSSPHSNSQSFGRGKIGFPLILVTHSTLGSRPGMSPEQ